MTLSDKLLVSLNMLLLVFAFLGFASMDEETLIVSSLLAMMTAAANGGAILHRRRQAKRAPARDDPADELDARTILDLDARLEAIEKAQASAGEAARWSALIETGAVSAPMDGDISPSARQRDHAAHEPEAR